MKTRHILGARTLTFLALSTTVATGSAQAAIYGIAFIQEGTGISMAAQTASNSTASDSTWFPDGISLFTTLGSHTDRHFQSVLQARGLHRCRLSSMLADKPDMVGRLGCGTSLLITMV